MKKPLYKEEFLVLKAGLETVYLSTSCSPYKT